METHAGLRRFTTFHTETRHMTRKNDEPQIIGDIMLDNPALAAVLVKALQQRVKTVEKLVDHLLTERRTAARNSRSWDHGARIEKIEETQINSLFDAADGERARDARIKTLEAQVAALEGGAEGLAVWKRCIERTVDPHGDMDLT